MMTINIAILFILYFIRCTFKKKLKIYLNISHFIILKYIVKFDAI
jgi:hypothetical protein